MTQPQDAPRDMPLALVVEDEALLALELEALLDAEGFASRIACTEAEALRLLADPFSVAVVNLRLGGQVRGQDIIGRLRARQPELPIVVVTGYDRSAPQADLRGLGWPTVRLQKPIEGDTLGRAVRDVITRARTGRHARGGRRRADRPQPA